MASRSVASTAERLAGIVAAAEQAASKVIDDAEEQARQRLREAEAEADALVSERLAALAGLTDSLIAQSEAIRRQAQQLLGSMEDVKGLIEDGGGTMPAPGDGDGPARGSHLSAVAPVEEEPPSIAGRRAPGSDGAGARLLATQMAVSGSSREEIASRLRSGFEIEDTSSILDAILGPED